METKTAPKRLKRILVGLAKLAAAAIVLYAAGRQIAEAWSSIDSRSVELSPLYFVISGILYLAGLAFFGGFWRAAASDMGGKMGHIEALRAYYVSQLGKYIPGKAWLPVIRCALVDRDQTPVSVTALSSVYETVAMMGIGALLAVVTLIAGGLRRTDIILASAGLSACLSGLVIPFVFTRLVRVIGVPLRKKGNELARPIRYGTLVKALYMQTAGWILLGLSLAAAAAGIGQHQWSAAGILLAIGSCALAVSGGFVAIVVPAGIGVREWILIQTLSPVMGPGVAALTAVAMRLIQVVTELAISGILYWSYHGRMDNDKRHHPNLQ